MITLTHFIGKLFNSKREKNVNNDLQTPNRHRCSIFLTHLIILINCFLIKFSYVKYLKAISHFFLTYKTSTGMKNNKNENKKQHRKLSESRIVCEVLMSIIDCCLYSRWWIYFLTLTNKRDFASSFLISGMMKFPRKACM